MSPRVGFLDTETTGFDPATGDRIAEICILTYDFNTRECIDTYVQRIDIERNMPAQAQAIHGISYEDLVGKPKWHEVAPTVAAKLGALHARIAHNMDFDDPFIGHELMRVGQPLPVGESYCTMKNGRWATFDGKSPKLEELAFALGVEFDPTQAHGAEYDTQKLAECFFVGWDRGFYVIPSLKSMMLAAAA